MMDLNLRQEAAMKAASARVTDVFKVFLLGLIVTYDSELNGSHRTTVGLVG